MSWAWGVDQGEHAAHFAFIPMLPGGGKPLTISSRWSSPSGARKAERIAHPRIDVDALRLVEQRSTLLRFIPAMARHYPPSTIAVERPTGTFPRQPLIMALGVTLEAFGTLNGLPVPWLIGTSEWKKAVGLPGHAAKLPIAEWATRNHGFDPERDPQDHADALGIAAAAKAIVWTNPQAAA